MIEHNDEEQAAHRLLEDLRLLINPPHVVVRATAQPYTKRRKEAEENVLRAFSALIRMNTED